MAYIKNLSALEYEELIKQEKQQSYITLKMLKYIYFKHLNNKHIDSFEQYFNDASCTYFVNPSVNEQRIKTLLKDFDKNFEYYKDLPCFSGLQGFNNNNKNASDYYFNDKAEKRTFDLARYVNVVSDANGKLKNVATLKAIPESEIKDLSKSIIDFLNITNECATRLGGLGFSR